MEIENTNVGMQAPVELMPGNDAVHGNQNELEKIKEAFYERLAEQPAEVAVELEELIAKYPQEHYLRNWRLMAYRMAGESEEKFIETLKKDYEEVPEYLFAKYNYAQWCFSTGAWQEIPKIFNNAKTIKELCPERENFYVKELIGFYLAWGQYYCYAGNANFAVQYMKMLEQISPESSEYKKLNYLVISTFPHLLLLSPQRDFSFKKHKKNKANKKRR